MNAKPTPPRGTTRAPAGPRPPDLAPCPGYADCGETIPRTQIACPACWKLVPGRLKSAFSGTRPGVEQRKRVVNRIRAYLRGELEVGEL